MSSLVPRFVMILVPCTLVACADRMRAAQYAPGALNEAANSEGYLPQEMESRPMQRLRIESRRNQTIAGDAPRPQPIAKPEQNIPAMTTPPAREFSAREPVQSPSQEEYSEAPVKRIAFRPGIAPRAGRHPLLWEKQKAESVMWSTYAMQIIGDEAANSLLPGTEDIGEFCPRYNELERELRINFWAYLVSAIAEVESSFDPGNRFTEKSLGIDKVTKKTVVSEGLLQLSYQDTRGYSGCDFDWEADRQLSEGDLSKSILDPFKNLRCGIVILAHQVKTRERISVDGGYWSVLRPDGRKYSKINQIKRRTRKLVFCG